VACAAQRPSLTASARGVTEPRRIGTKKRPLDRTKKLTSKKLKNVAPFNRAGASTASKPVVSSKPPGGQMICYENWTT
jgi:hypothetical protein